MNKIKSLFRRLYYKLAVISSQKATRRNAGRLFLNFMDSNNFRYSISHDQSFIESGFDLSDGHSTTVYYEFSEIEKRIFVQSHFLKLETDQIPTASVLIAHLNSLIRKGTIKINFERLQVYFEREITYSALVLEPDDLHVFHRQIVWMPKDFLWCFQQVLEANEDPVVVMGELMRKHGI